MGFFQDLKEDLSLAVNELLPEEDGKKEEVLEAEAAEAMLAEEEDDEDVAMKELEAVLTAEFVEGKPGASEEKQADPLMDVVSSQLAGIAGMIAREEPVREKSITEKTEQVEEAPVVEPPVVETPVAEPPVVETPVVEAPVAEPPVVETPVVEAPVAEPPVVETPVVEASVAEPPVVETPVVEAPAAEPPVVETPVVEAPVVETPVVETPVVEAPVVEAPVVETPATEVDETEERQQPLVEEMTSAYAMAAAMQPKEETKLEKEVGKVIDKQRMNLADEAVSDEDAVITAGMEIVGDIISKGNVTIEGCVRGNIEVLGKLCITGKVEGDAKAAEVFADSAKVIGTITAEGTVKIGEDSVVIGNVSSSSAVIAGAIKGDLDVHGPVILDAHAIVMGNIKSKSVQINNGATIEGMCSQCYAETSPVAFFEGLTKKVK